MATLVREAPHVDLCENARDRARARERALSRAGPLVPRRPQRVCSQVVSPRPRLARPLARQAARWELQHEALSLSEAEQRRGDALKQLSIIRPHNFFINFQISRMLCAEVCTITK